MYLLLGSAGQEPGEGGGCTDQHDRVSASSGIASGTSSQPWLEDQDLSGSSCECNTDNSQSSRRSKRSSLTKRRQRQNNNNSCGVTKAQCHSPVSSRESNASPGLNTAYRAMVSLARNTTPSIEQSCLTETTDCPSDISVITSISAAPHSEELIQRVSEVQLSRARARISLPPTHLRAMLRDRLRAEAISLSSHPYTQVSTGPGVLYFEIKFELLQP